MSDKYYECSECGAVNLGDGACPTCKEASSLAAPLGSAIAHQNRRRVWEELEALKTWIARLESELQKEPDGVIPWIQLQSLSEATSRLLYAAGHVNALRLAGVSPNKQYDNFAQSP